jgi:DNA-directed RNA polymerase specialized sigma24 family protein
MAEQRPTAVESGPTQLTPAYEVYADGYGGSHEPDYSSAYDGAAQEYTIASPVQRRPGGLGTGLGAGDRIGLRGDFGAHFEANYQRLVGQLFAITLNSAEAHDVVQDAYSRAWRQWSAIGRSPDPAAWVRRVAVRSTVRSWRRRLAWIGVGRPTRIADEAVDPRTGAVLAALARLSIAERRAVVLHHMAGWSVAEIATVERSSPGAVNVRLARGSQAVERVLPQAFDDYGPDYGPDYGYDEEQHR